MKRRFVQLDVFAEQPYAGNPLAVVVDGDGLTTDDMQRFAKWTNLSETTFLLPPTNSSADYGVRIFTTTRELPFAGHPTLGSAHAWLQSGGVPKNNKNVVQECGVGLVDVRLEEDTLAFAAPPLLKSGAVDEELMREAVESLGISRESVVAAEWIDNGPGWMGILLRSANDVLNIQPSLVPLPIGVAGAHEPGSRFSYEVRAFIPANGVTIEDPVTGSLNASFAQWFIGSQRFAAPYLVSQGTAIGHKGVIHISDDDSHRFWIGGNVVTCISGAVDI